MSSAKIRIVGGTPLQGQVRISGAKNAALPLMAASLLTDQRLTLSNIPYRLTDIDCMEELLHQHGVGVNAQEDVVELWAHDIKNTVAPYDIVSRMRASILVLGPLLARTGEAKVSLPGGCAIGTRPVDIHISGMRQLGAHIELSEGYIQASAPNGLTGTDITMPLVTVTGTENLMMAACLAKGETRLINAAREPEIIDLAHCLTAMGAYISGAGTDTIVIQGVEKLRGAHHRVMPDRIETGTYLMAAVITGGELELVHTSAEYISGVISTLKQAGVDIHNTDTGLKVRASTIPIQGVDIMTEPYPGFSTDLQAQIMAVMTVCQGASMITETIWENRFMHVPELCRMGANISVHHSSALVRGTRHLSGAEVMATDLRASVSLVLAGLVARGETMVSRVYHLDRGYEQLEQKLIACGAIVERIKI
jgi:UDP-N-acetylglucosamine 1-carboxyvinyltransferase